MIRIDSRYHVVRPIGEGGTGTVYLAHDLLLERPVAVKVLRDQVIDLRDEGRSLARIGHPNVVAIYDLLRHGGQYYLLMEYVEGKTLEQVLTERGTLPTDRAVSILRQVAAAVAHAHERGILHCDLKPANVLISTEGSVKLTDFTLSRRRSDGYVAGAHGGTTAFAAPEQFDGVVSPRTDVYGLGALLRAMVHPSEMDRAVCEVVERATSHEPDDRFPSVAALLEALPSSDGATQIVPSASISPVTRLLPARLPGARKSGRGVLVASCVALSLALAGVSVHFTVLASPARVIVPALASAQTGPAERAIRSLGLRPRLHWRYANLPAGTVLSQTPAAGSALSRDSSVMLTVSRGPAPVPVPDVRGVKGEDAMRSLLKSGFHVSVETRESISDSADTVLAQSPAPSSERLPGTTVVLTVSKKPWWWIF